MLAASKGQTLICGYLCGVLSAEVLNAVDKANRNALILALVGGHVDTMEVLAQHGVSITYSLPAPSHWNLLFFAVFLKSAEGIRFCCTHGLSPVRRNEVGKRARSEA